SVLLRATTVVGLVFRYANTSCSGMPISFSSHTIPVIEPSRRRRRSRNGALSSATRIGAPGAFQYFWPYLTPAKPSREALTRYAPALNGENTNWPELPVRTEAFPAPYP